MGGVKHLMVAKWGVWKKHGYFAPPEPSSFRFLYILGKLTAVQVLLVFHSWAFGRASLNLRRMLQLKRFSKMSSAGLQPSRPSFEST